ncbi:MAG: phospholipase [Pirellulales bacterium]
MNSTADILRQLHRIHRQLADLNERANRGPKAITVREANVFRLQSALEESRENTLQARKATDSKQLQLQSGEDKIGEFKTKLNTANSNREYQALLEQIEADKMTNSVLEDEILEGLDRIDELQVEAGQAAKQLEEGEQRLAETKKNVADESDTIRADMQRLEAELNDAEKCLPNDFHSEYSRVVKVRGDAAMAHVEDDCCSGCYQRVTPNMINKLMMDQIVCCTSCGCILYFPES